MKKHRINGVLSYGVAEELGIEAGDKLLAIDGREIKDVFDFRYLTGSGEFELQIEKADGECWDVEVEMDEDEELGLVFENDLMDEARSCSNNCVFCFISQLPCGMRETLYFKDDDLRLSFLQGNYVTLTNISEKELDRLIYYRLSPINISVHTTNPALRCEMLGNKQAAKLEGYLEKIASSKIEMNFQIVLCKGINDGGELDKTVKSLERFMPNAKSLSVVPVGLSRFRDELPLVEGFDENDAKTVIEQIERWQSYFLEKHGTRFLYAADEFYIKSGKRVPPYESYEDFPQIENGVGMLAELLYEIDDALADCEPCRIPIRLTAVTGAAASGYMAEIADRLRSKNSALDISFVTVYNNFFGKSITVSGLITGQDILDTLKGRDLKGVLLIPVNMMRSGEKIFLDNMTVSELEEALKTKIIVVTSGYELADVCVNARRNK